MRTLRDVPIKQKLLVIVLVTTAAALALSGVATVMLDSVLFRTTMRHDLSALAGVVADNTKAALSSQDPRAAMETLAALRSRPHMMAACIYGEKGEIFARYLRPGAAVCPAPLEHEEVRTVRGNLLVSRPIMLQQRTIGHLVLLYDMGEAQDRVVLYGQTVLAILLASSLIALLLSSRLRAVIVTPVLRLARAAAAVSRTGDYSVRVEKESADELGVLVDAFNQMLARIQSRDIEVQNARNLLETTLTSIGDAVISTGVDGRIVFANPVARSLLRWADAEIAGHGIEEVFRIAGETGCGKLESPVERVLREDARAGVASQAVLTAGDGTEVPIEFSAAPIRRDGRMLGVVLVFRDIGERQRAQQDTAYLAAIVESSEDAIFGVSPEGIIRTWNPGAERLHGYTAGELIGHSIRELVPADRQQEETNILEQLRQGRVLHFETVHLRKGGEPVDISLTVSPMRDESGRITGSSHVARDITQLKKYAEEMRQTQKLESLGVLAGGIAHDFNNLLTGILGNASLALDEMPPGSPAGAALGAAIEASERAAQLARQMLAYSGKGHFVLETVDVSTRVRDIVPLIKAAIPAAVELRLRLEEKLPAIEADAAQLQQLIMNIIINGAEAIPEGKAGTVTVTTRRERVGAASLRAQAPGGSSEPAAGEYVVFEVADTGTGMDEATRARIFDPFFTTKFTGRGLGLAAVQGIVRGHKGAIQVASAPGKGTTFRVLFPAAEGKREAKAAAGQARAMDLCGTGTVLVIDDEPIVRKLAGKTLERFGYAVLLAEDGARGLEIFARERERIRCVVLDLTMPVMSGEETLARMQALSPDIPVILSSGFNEVHAVRRFKGKGLAAFLQKPYKAPDLLAKVKLAMARRERGRAQTVKPGAAVPPVG